MRHPAVHDRLQADLLVLHPVVATLATLATLAAFALAALPVALATAQPAAAAHAWRRVADDQRGAGADAGGLS